MEFVLAYITTKDKEEAAKLGRLLLEERLAACVNILPAMQSLYWWEGKIESSQEAVLIVKTVKKAKEALIGVVKKNHSYSVPCVLFLDVLDGSRDYLNWLAEQVDSNKMK